MLARPLCKENVSLRAAGCRGTVTPALIAHPPLALARSEAELQQLEAANRVYELYCWLAYRFEDAFAGREQAGEARAACAKLIDESIRQMGALSRRQAGMRCGEGQRGRGRWWKPPKASRVVRHCQCDHIVACIHSSDAIGQCAACVSLAACNLASLTVSFES